MDVILLRKMAYKSKIGFGKYAELTVGDLINDRKGLYLKWLYCYIDGITFTDDILDDLHIPVEMRINKPGVDHDLYERIIRNFWAAVHEFDPKLGKLKIRGHNAKKVKAKLICKQILRHETRGSLQRRNQGHR